MHKTILSSVCWNGTFLLFSNILPFCFDWSLICNIFALACNNSTKLSLSFFHLLLLCFFFFLPAIDCHFSHSHFFNPASFTSYHLATIVLNFLFFFHLLVFYSSYCFVSETTKMELIKKVKKIHETFLFRKKCVLKSSNIYFTNIFVFIFFSAQTIRMNPLWFLLVNPIT